MKDKGLIPRVNMGRLLIKELPMKQSQRSPQEIFNHLGDLLAARGYEKSKARGNFYWQWQISPEMPIYTWDGKLGQNKLFIDASLTELAQTLGSIKGVVASRSGVTKNHKFEAFVAKKVNPHTQLVEYEGWRFQFVDEVSANKFLDVCDDYTKSGLDAAKLKAQSFEQTITRATSRSSVVTSRVGQDIFRKDLLRHWKSCAVTGCKVTAALRASHIKPWAACDSKERLDPLNGLLLVASLDALFDAGLISFEDSGAIVISPRLLQDAWPALGVTSTMRLRKPNSAHEPYLAYHREHVYKK